MHTKAAMTEEQLKHQLNLQFAQFYGLLSKRFDELNAQIRTKASAERLEDLYNITDGIAKRLDDLITEKEILNHRYKGWFKQLSDNTHTKLQPDL